MKKKIWIAALLVIALLGVLFVPVQTGVYKDGGTVEYRALTYRVVKWNRLTEDGTYEKTRCYFFGDLFKSIDQLWEREEPYVTHLFLAAVIELSGNTALVEPLEQEAERSSSDRISFDTFGLADIGAEVGSVVQVTYQGLIRESYPAGVDAIDWEIAGNLRHMEYTGQWLDEKTAQPVEAYSRDVTITRIYSNCFFARELGADEPEIKINGGLSDEWCPGDKVIISFAELFVDEQGRMEGEMNGLFWIQPDPDDSEMKDYKPVIYLYPEEETEVSVRLTLDGKLTCTYPAYEDGWTVRAQPDGTLTDARGQSYNYLYWEGDTYAKYDLSQGFCVRGEDTAAFLETALEKLGLNRREANEFIVYWLPQMECNPYNIISFQTDIYTDAAVLEVVPMPDTLIRVFMAWRSTDTPVELPEQALSAPERTGFTVVEWGGTEIK